MNAIKENIVAILVIGGLFVGYIELRAPQMVEDAMTKRGLVSNSAFTELKKDVEELEEMHVKDNDKMDSKVERIVDILLEN